MHSVARALQRCTVLGPAPLRPLAIYSTSRLASTSTHHLALPLPTARTRLLLLLTALSVTGSFVLYAPTVKAESPVDHDALASERKRRKFRLKEVREHGAHADRVWCHHGTAVYDITDWIPNHPGGTVILQAAGTNIAQYWDIFTVHKNDDVKGILEQFRIGELDERDLVNGEAPEESVNDPFASDPKRSDRLHLHVARPCNAESPADSLEDQLTKNDLFYVRNHMWVPSTDGEKHLIVIELPNGDEIQYTVEELKKRFKQHEVEATLQCSGNRRSHMSKFSRHALGLQWDVGAIGNATWRGVRLRDVLREAGVKDEDAQSDEQFHVQFEASEAYGASIPLYKALDARGDVLLAFEMNGECLPPDHGYPVRVLVPGHVAARSVKWVNRIRIADEESHSQWQRRDYKVFGPNVRASEADWSRARAIQETPVQSAITSITQLSTKSAGGRRALSTYGLEDDSVVVKGYAYAGGGRNIERVDVSFDGGRSWTQAELVVGGGDEKEQPEGRAWSWRHWSAVAPRHTVGKEICVKASDSSYNTQPESYEAIYNFKGNLATAWDRRRFEWKDEQ